MKANATLSKTAMTRHGKIARLPLAIRQQLNHLPQHGKLAQDLLSWLNQKPEVQAIPPVSPPGLSNPNLIEPN
jgi:hypothetical protein